MRGLEREKPLFRKAFLFYLIAIPTFFVRVCVIPGFAQYTSGTINGRVVDEDGQPLSHAKVYLMGVGGGKNSQAGRSAIVTDREGNFTAESLDPIPYLITAISPGYVPAPGSISQSQFNPQAAHYVHIGESVQIRMARGGVITGRVTNAAGEPVIGIGIYTTRIRDEAGRPAAKSPDRIQGGAMTNDRGIYRIFGLASGTYVVWAGMSRGSSIRPMPFTGKSPTYHPSSTRDAASPVKVSLGQETIGIDIRYRGESGFAISGKILGAPHRGSAEIYLSSTTILLRNPKTGDVLAMVYAQAANEYGYAFYGIQKGEYEILAQDAGGEDGNGLSSPPRQISVTNMDLNGVDLRLAVAASISGIALIEKSVTENERCEPPRSSWAGEIVIRPRRDEPKEKPELLWPELDPSSVGVPNDQGIFTLRNLRTGRYRLGTELPDETWYLKSMTLPGAIPPIDPRSGVVLKAGEKLSGLRLTIATGAASLRGKVLPAENATLPTRLRVHLLPAERESKEDLLRFYEVETAADGRFHFMHLAPGKYWLYAQAVSAGNVEENAARPAAWDAVERTKLRREAEAADLPMEFTPCQRKIDYLLRLSK